MNLSRWLHILATAAVDAVVVVAVFVVAAILFLAAFIPVLSRIYTVP